MCHVWGITNDFLSQTVICGFSAWPVDELSWMTSCHLWPVVTNDEMLSTTSCHLWQDCHSWRIVTVDEMSQVRNCHKRRFIVSEVLSCCHTWRVVTHDELPENKLAEQSHHFALVIELVENLQAKHHHSTYWLHWPKTFQSPLFRHALFCF